MMGQNVMFHKPCSKVSELLTQITKSWTHEQYIPYHATIVTLFISGTCVDVFVAGTTHAGVDGVSQAAHVRDLDPGPMSRPQGRHHVSHRLGQQVRPALTVSLLPDWL